jgi:polar amino acid transport system substrate-binding protein
MSAQQHPGCERREGPIGPRPAGLPCLLFLALFTQTGFAPGKEPLQVYYNERPPYLVPHADGSVSGLTADPAAYALRRAGIAFTWVAMPSSRQLLKLQENHARLAAVGWFKNPERESFAKFSEPLYQDRQIVALARQDNAQVSQARTLEDLLRNQELTLLKKSGYSYGKQLDEGIARWAPSSIQVTVENISMIQMIHARRADYLFIAPEEAESAIRWAGVPAAEVQTKAFPDMPPGEKRYLLFSGLVDEETIRRINKYISEYRAARKQ